MFGIAFILLVGLGVQAQDESKPIIYYRISILGFQRIFNMWLIKSKFGMSSLSEQLLTCKTVTKERFFLKFAQILG